MNFKIHEKFFRWRQAELDELVEDYLYDLADENNCNVKDLDSLYSFKTLQYMIFRFTEEVQKIWSKKEQK
jgi:hypothetical protein